MQTNTTFTGNDYVCSYCGTAFTGETCPNCCSNTYEKSKERIEWEQQQERLIKQEQELEKHKVDANESATKHDSNVRLIMLIAFLAVFVISWLSHFFFMASLF